MSRRHFGDFVAELGAFEGRLAMTIRPFLKIKRLSYGELQRRVYQTANYLLARNVGSGDRLAVVANNSPEWVELFLGAALIGAVLVPIDASGTVATTLRLIDLTDPKWVFHQQHLHPELGQSRPAVSLDDLDESIVAYPGAPPNVRLAADRPALIVFTSGTTADPKGVVLTHENVLANVKAALRVVGVGSDWRFLSVLPLSHMYELTGGLLAPLSSGASIFYVPSVSPVAIARALQEYRVTTVLAVPELLTLLLEGVTQEVARQKREKAFARALRLAAILPVALRRQLFEDVHSQLGGRLNLVITGGAPIPLDVGTAWERMGVRVLQGYGLTETAPILTMNSLHRRRLDSPGRALDNISLRIGDDGEIQARGPSVFGEY